MVVLSRLVRVAALACATSGLAAGGLAGCGLESGAPAEWILVSEIQGPLAAELGPTPQPPPLRARPSSQLRVVTYNVHLGADPTWLANDILANSELASADVFLFQEEEAFPGEGSTRTSRIAELLGMGWVYIPGRMKDDGTHGLAILSRLPIEEPCVMSLPATEQWKPRIAMRADIVVGERRLPIVNVHLETRINITDRILQIRPTILDLPETAIVAGDVNTNPYLWEEGEVPLVPTAQIVDTDQAPILDDYMRAVGFATPAANVGPTHRVHGVESRLDAIFTRGLATTDARVERTLTASDHWPVWVDVSW